MIPYVLPRNWIAYDSQKIAQPLAEAMAAVLSLKTLPYQKDWVEQLQQIQLKREVAGTSRIEGAEFTEAELDRALEETPAELETRSQRQAHAAVQTYRWINTVPEDFPITVDLIKEIHRRIVTGADDDHCAPGVLRGPDQNVTFGQPRHRGVNGGNECEAALSMLADAMNRQFKDHDPLVQALAAHYHFAAMHPFLDGNGRTARALEAMLLRRAGLRDSAFIAMSNYYYDEKTTYLTVLGEVRKQDHDLTPFLLFGLKGIALQANRLLAEIQVNVQKALFRNMMYDLFGRLQSPRKRVIAERQIATLRILLDRSPMKWAELYNLIKPHYGGLKDRDSAIARDMVQLQELGTITAHKNAQKEDVVSIRLDWPTRITESEFMNQLNTLPKAKSFPFLS